MNNLYLFTLFSLGSCILYNKILKDKTIAINSLVFFVLAVLAFIITRNLYATTVYLLGGFSFAQLFRTEILHDENLAIANKALEDIPIEYVNLKINTFGLLMTNLKENEITKPIKENYNKVIKKYYLFSYLYSFMFAVALIANSYISYIQQGFVH